MKFGVTGVGCKALLLLTLLICVGCGGGQPKNAQSSPPPIVTPPPTPPPPPPAAVPTATLSANPTSITQGSSSVLAWATTNATTIDIDLIGPIPANGSLTTTPTVTTTYTLTATGAGGTATSTATVTVIPSVVAPTPPPPPNPPPPPPPPTPLPVGIFTLTILEPLPAASEAEALAINDSGIAVGYSVFELANGQSSTEATMWKEGAPIDLGQGIATGINATNQVSGHGDGPPNDVDNGSSTQAWFWSASTGRIVIGPLFGESDSVSLGIDDNGTIGGEVFTSGGPEKDGFIWDKSKGPLEIPSMLEVDGIANVIPDTTEAGAQLAGTSRNLNQAVITSSFTSNTPIFNDLGPGGSPHSSALAINHLGHVCGEIDDNDESLQAMFWTPGSLFELGTGGTRYSTGLALNDGDQVVGIMGDAPAGMIKLKARLSSHKPSLLQPRTLDNFDRAMIWTLAMGIVDLNTLIGNPTGWTLSLANGINNRGEIVGTAFDGSQINKAYILAPEK